MANSCYGLHPVNASRAYIKLVDSYPYYQHELFSYSVDKYWNPKEEKFSTIEYYLPLPYDYAVTYVRSYEQAS